MSASVEDDGLLDELAALRPEQNDAFACSLRASVRSSLAGAAAEPFRLGRFTVLEPLGGGGMGVVFVAYDPDLDRKIALKVLRDGGQRGQREVLREGRALARLKHPNVVAVYEVGVIDEQVFVAMEYIAGQNLREWLRRPRATEAILARLVEAGRGLAAAHAVGLVHRDCKPENVVIDTHDHARVIDFGLARPVEELPEPGRHGVGSAAASMHGGTPAYMAPERLAGGAGDHRADQYSFAVTCWEALFGAHPTSERAITPPLGRSVPGWLRKVLERGMSVDPAHRYPTTEAMLAALGADPTRRRRVLAGVTAAGLAVAGWFGVWSYAEAQQVAACEAEGASISEVWNEQAQAQLRDGLHATGVAYAAATADKVMPFLAAQAEAWRQARTETCLDARVREAWDEETLDRSRWCLDERRTELATLVAELSRASATSAQNAVQAVASLSRIEQCRDVHRLERLPPLPPDRQGVRRILEELLRADALQAAGDYAQGLEAARAGVDAAEAFGWPPLVAAARLRHGRLLAAAGRLKEAEAALEAAFFQAAEVSAPELGAHTAVALMTTVGSGLARFDDGRRWARHADVMFTLLGVGAEGSLRIAALRASGNIEHAAGKFADAKTSHEQALAAAERELGPEHPEVAAHLDSLAMDFWAMSAFDEAARLYERALAIRERALGEDHPSVADSLNSLAVVYQSRSLHEEAKVLHDRALAIREEALGPEHPSVARSLHNLATMHYLLGAYAEAKPLFERALAIREKALGREHPDFATSLGGLALTLEMSGSFAEAKALHEQVLVLLEKTLGPDHPDVADALNNLAFVSYATGGYEEARARHERALPILEKAFGRGHPHFARQLNNLGRVLLVMGSYAEAKALFEQAQPIYVSSLGPDHPETADSLGNLGDVLVAMGAADQARPFHERALAIREQALGPDHPRVAGSLTSLAKSHSALGAHDAARALLERALAINEKALSADHMEITFSLVGLVEVALAQGRAADAVALAERVTRIRETGGAPGDELAEGRFLLAQALWDAPVDRGRDRTRAQTLALQARDALRTVKGKSQQLAAVEGFLRRHGGAR
ncbi:serine/threonine-protein kinase [Nannocystis radixulma]|uniref:Serine/threonine-protein kinase n=1 Tax=Nannocystis radixulma TaxID=2995305 RepID=A0ABT5B578_9BACT|nr:serine/threonine-protein kinase [Nannocystis radixulma]MDC0669264.1 serine/threonine-protein kinase [Nannocystis radixulma]